MTHVTMPLLFAIACSEARLPTDTGLDLAAGGADTAAAAPAGGLVLNELLADSDESADWIELYNPTSAPVALDGYALTDKVGELPPWPLPAGLTLAPGAHLLIWADEGETAGEDDALHADFKLSKDGEAVALLHPDGGLADEVLLPASGPDESWGRRTDGDGPWDRFTPPTPAAPNARTAE